jgi:hypothetical protein
MQASLLLPQVDRFRFIRSTFKHLRSEPRFQHKWRTADDFATLCHKWFTIPEPLQFNGNDLNSALLRDPSLKLDIKAEKSAPNQFGIYHDTHRPKDSNRRSHCYFLCDPANNECVINPPVGKKWYDTIEDISNEIQALGCATRAQEQERQFPADVIDLVSKAKAIVQERDKLVDNGQNVKRRRLLDAYDCNGDSITSNSQEEEQEEARDGRSEDIDAETPKPPQLAPGYNIWWDSTEAQMLFNSSKEKETVIDRLQDLTAILDNSTFAVGLYRTIVEGHDADNIMSDHKKENIQMRARYLAQAYRIAIEEMPFKTWNDCCQEAINQLAAVFCISCPI